MSGLDVTHGLPPLGLPDSEGVGQAERRRLKLGWIITFALLAVALGLLGWGLYKSMTGPRSSGDAPDFTLTSYDGRSVALARQRGKVVIVNFWASWCPPCREEAAYLEQTWRKYRDRDVLFVGVDWVDTPANALAYMKEFDLTYPNGPDTGTRIAQSYRIQGVPETFFVDRKGRLRGVKIGPLQAPELDQKIEELLAEK